MDLAIEPRLNPHATHSPHPPATAHSPTTTAGPPRRTRAHSQSPDRRSSTSSVSSTSSSSSPPSSVSSATHPVVPAYPYNVSMTPYASNGQHQGPVPDDTAVKSRLPSICVDYLSHDWSEDDVWTSWKQMTRQKHEIANGVRLENASWRTWAKQRGALKTISPETLNWLKDSDVTWLYGPLHTAVEPVPLRQPATAVDRLGLDDAGHKSILKHRSLSDVLLMAGPPSPILEAAKSTDEEDDEEGEDSVDSSVESDSRPPFNHTHSDSHIFRNRRSRGKESPPRIPRRQTSPDVPEIPMPVSALKSRSRSAAGGGQNGQNKRRHISFNHRVEQCIAVDQDEAKQPVSTFADSGESDEDDDALTFRSSPRTQFNVLSAVGGGSVGSKSRRKRAHSSRDQHQTIAKLAPTTLKSSEVLPAPSPVVVYHESRESTLNYAGPSYASAPYGAETSSFSQEDENSPPQPADWNEEEAEAGGIAFDYFSGPDLGVGDEYELNGVKNATTSTAASGSSNTSNRSAASSTTSTGSGPSTPTGHPSSSSSSSSSTAKSKSDGPGRSILKNRSGKRGSSSSLVESNDDRDGRTGGGDASPDTNSRGRSTLRRNGSNSSLDRSQAGGGRTVNSSISPGAGYSEPGVTIANAAGAIGQARSSNESIKEERRSSKDDGRKEGEAKANGGVGAGPSTTDEDGGATPRPNRPPPIDARRRDLLDHDYDSDDGGHLFDSPAIPGSPAATDLDRNSNSFTSLHQLRWSDEPDAHAAKRLGSSASGTSPRSPTAATFGVPGRGSSGSRSRSSMEGAYGRSSGDDYSFYSDDESGVVGRTIEIVGTARDLVGALWNVGMNTFWKKGERGGVGRGEPQ